MEYVQLEGIYIHEDGYAKFIELTLLTGIRTMIFIALSPFFLPYSGIQ